MSRYAQYKLGKIMTFAHACTAKEYEDRVVILNHNAAYTRPIYSNIYKRPYRHSMEDPSQSKVRTFYYFRYYVAIESTTGSTSSNSKLSTNLFIYESCPNHEKIEDVLIHL